MRYNPAVMELVDTHCHLNFSPLDSSPARVIERAGRRGVTRIVVPAYDPASWKDVAALARLEGVYPAFGVHPWAADRDFNIVDLENFLIRHDAVAVGEIGLDFKIASPGTERQTAVFIEQLRLAAKLELPVMLHCRGAFEEMLQILSDFQGRLKGVIHAFSKGPTLCARFQEMGMHVAFGGAVTRPRADRARRSAAVVGEERILLETDAPSIGIDGVEPEKTEPHHVADIAAAVAEIRGETLERVAAITTENAKRLFRFNSKQEPEGASATRRAI